MQMMPHAPDVERALIAAFLVDAEAVERVPMLSGSDFYERPHAVLFDAILGLRKANQPVDLVTVTTALTDAGKLDAAGGLVYLSDLTGSKYVTACNVEAYAAILHDKSILRNVIAVCGNAIDAAHNAEDAGACLHDLEASVFGLGEDVTVDNLLARSVSELMLGVEKRRRGEKVIGLKTGIEAWDYRLSGLVAGRFYALAARGGTGKTAMVEQMVMDQLLAGVPVLVFQKDMSTDAMVARMACRHAGVPFFRYDTGGAIASELNAVESAGKILAKTPLVLMSPSGLTAPQMVSIIRREKRVHGIQSVFLDHVLKLSVDKEDLRQGLVKASNLIRQSVQDTGLPHVIVAQLNRNAEGVRPRPSDVMEFDALFQDCDVLAMLWSDQNPSTLAPGALQEMKLLVNKNRYGPVFEETIGFNRELLKYVTLTDETDTRSQPYAD